MYRSLFHHVPFILLLSSIVVITTDNTLVAGHADEIHNVIIYRLLRYGQNIYTEIYTPPSFDFRLHRFANVYLPPQQQSKENAYLDLCTLPPASSDSASNGDGDGDGTDVGSRRRLGDGISAELASAELASASNIVNPNNLRRDSIHNIKNQRNLIHKNDDNGVDELYRNVAWWSQPSDKIALVVWNSNNCSQNDMAKNAMKLNDMYGMENGPRISYLLVHGRKETLQNDHVTATTSTTTSTTNDQVDENQNHNNNTHTDQDDEEEDIDIHILRITTQRVLPIIKQMGVLSHYHNHLNNNNNQPKPNLHLTKDSFYPFFNTDRDPWAYNIILAQIGSSSHAHFAESQWIYIIITTVLALPILRTCCLIYFTGRRLVFDRNERGWIVGFHMEQMFHNTNDLLDFPIHLKETLTVNQVEELPIIEYKVSDLKQMVKNYYAEHESNPWFTRNDNSNNDDDDEDEDEEAEIVESSDEGDDINLKAPPVKEKEQQQQCEEKKENYTLLLNDNSSDHDDDNNNIHNNDDDDESEIDTCSFIDRAYAGCTSCHICLADFDEGERLVLLPRCGHLFHYDCILPWLRDHKSLCPSCKTEVIQHENNDTASMAVLP